MACNTKCWYASGDKCTCTCNGKNHGKGRNEQEMVRIEKSYPNKRGKRSQQNKEEKNMTTQQKRKALKKAGAEYTNNIGWAFPDDDGTCWFDNSSYNHTIFLGRNAEEAYDEMLEIKEIMASCNDWPD